MVNSCSRNERSTSMVSCWEIRAFSISSWDLMREASANCSCVACSVAISVCSFDFCLAISRSCFNRANSRCLSISSAFCSVSKFLLRILMVVSCSISLRFFLRVSICSVNWVRPSASNTLEGLKTSKLAWSRLVRDTASSTKPVSLNDSATNTFTDLI